MSKSVGWMRVKAAAKYADCSERTFREWLKDGLRHVRIRGTIRTTPEWTDEYMLRGEVCEDVVDKIVEDVCRGL